MSKSVEVSEIGGFIDAVAGKIRTPKTVAGRLLEEVVELALSTGMTTGEVYESVADSIFNQATKLSSNSGFTLFPSQLNHYRNEDMDELSGECADVSLVLKDLLHVACVNINESERTKFEKLKTIDLHVSPKEQSMQRSLILNDTCSTNCLW